MFLSYDRTTRSLRYSAQPTPPSEAICDFCSAEGEVTHSCPAKVTRLPNGGISTGSWAACAPCANHIEKNDRVGLARHARAEFKKSGFNPSLASVVVAATHKCFWKSKLGAPVPWERD